MTQRASGLMAANSFDPAGPVARDIAGLWWLMLALGVAVMAVFGVALAVGLGRRSRAVRQNPSIARPGPADPGRSALRWIVVGGVVMPVVVLLVVFGFTVQTMRATPGAAPPDALRIDVLGHQWWYEVRYPDEGVTTANEMHIPVGRPVEIRLRSADVIHSFWVPALAGKLDMLPGRENVLVLEADEAGSYQGSCAEFCGLQHAKMRFLTVAEEPERFAAWLATQRRPAAEPSGGDIRRGREVFAAAGCGECHTVRGTPAGGQKGPDLTHLASRETLASGTLPFTRRHLAEWISDPQGVKRGTQMEAPDLSGEDLEALLAYLESLR